MNAIVKEMCIRNIPVIYIPKLVMITHILIILLFASPIKSSTLLLNTIPYIITLLTLNDIHFVAVFLKLRIKSSTTFDRFLFCNKSFMPKCKMATSKLPSSSIGET